ncbi:bifunctional DNA primase/polymerase [Pseudonocardia alaniniphila]|nr:bifunctional DNA primase/polymerase [Pseudonocardia alaniniphila]
MTTTTPHRQPVRRPGLGQTRRTGMRLGNVATAAATAGRYVFPIHPRSKIPAVTDWETAATRDLEQIRRWWDARPYNIGIATGRSGLLVVDLDLVPNDCPPEWAGTRGGFDVLARRAAAAGAPWPPHTLVVATATGGTHWYFRPPAGAQLRNTQGGPRRGLGWCVDTRGHGGYVLGPGSVRPDGTYRVVRRYPIAQLPGWLLAALTPPGPPPPPRALSRRPVSQRRAAAYLRAVVNGEIAAVAAAGVGDRHTTLLRAARRLGHWAASGALAEAEARAALTDAAQHFVGVAGYTAAHIARDITDGLAYGARRPRRIKDIPDRRGPANAPS